jgi:endonuclease-3
MPRESLTNKKIRAGKIIEILHRHYPGAKTALKHKSVHQLLVATILSAQCTDERVNMVTPGLFKKYPSIKGFAEADLKELGEDIKSTGFFNSKAKAIKQSAQELLERYGGKMPRTIDELVKLRGVGRKTASVVLGNAYGIAEGVVVDTHVARISRLLKLTNHKDPNKIEQDLMEVLPRDEWIDWSHMIILHGRAVCKARKPDCPNCPLADYCPSAFDFPHLKKR